MTYHVTHWVNGEPWSGSCTETMPIENPATGEVIGDVLLANTADVDHVVEVAKAAQKKWARVSLAKRVDIMFKMRQLVIDHADEIAEIIVAEGGKTHGDALGEIARGRESLDFACNINSALKGEFTDQASTGIDVHTIRQPVGVVAGVVPFNFPVMVPMWMHPIALATGNAFILKAATPVPKASHLIARLYQEAGLPDGLFNVIGGEVEAVTAILEHPGINAISFVGSTPVAHIVRDKGWAAGKRVQALGGANNHAIVMPDATMDFASQHISAGAFGAAGQRCMALPNVVTVAGAAEKLIPLVQARAEKIKVGGGSDPEAETGPVISKASLERITSWIDQAEAAGAEVVLDGRGYKPVGEEFAGGNWLGPTIVKNVPKDQPLYKDETFGPVLVVQEVDTYEEAIDLVNASPFGNGSAIFTSDGDVARQFTHDVEAGMVGVNVPIPVPVGYYSFGGWKESLHGDYRIHGPEGVKFYTKSKVITTRWPRRGEKVGQVGMNFPTNG